MPTRLCRATGAIAVLTLGLVSFATPSARTQNTGAPIPDRDYWRLVTELSEPGGVFAQQLMSNEDSAQFVLPALMMAVRPGGVYLGVGSEQNFTYIAAVRP